MGEKDTCPNGQNLQHVNTTSHLDLTSFIQEGRQSYCKWCLVENTHTTHNQETWVPALAFALTLVILGKLHTLSLTLLLCKVGFTSPLTLASQDYCEV